MGERGDEWTTVDRRRRNTNPIKTTTSGGDTITYYVSNLPDGCSGTTLWKEFYDFGNLVDAYVARKKDSRGNLFGFVRFSGIKDERLLLKDLNSIRIEGAKVSVNIAKYNKENHRILERNNQYEDHYAKENQRNHARNHQTTLHNLTKEKWQTFHQATGRYVRPTMNTGGNNSSFKDVLVGQQMQSLKKVVSIHANSAWFPETCKRRSLLCEAINLQCLINARKVLSAEGLYDMELIYVGGLYSLLTFKSTKEANDFTAFSEASWKAVFNKVVLWNGEEVPDEKIVCLKIEGVPLMVRDEATYNKIGEKFGRVLMPSDYSWDERDASVGKVYVLTKGGPKIDEEICVEWRNKPHKVWVREEDFSIWPDDEGLSNIDEDEDDNYLLTDDEIEDQDQIGATNWQEKILLRNL